MDATPPADPPPPEPNPYEPPRAPPGRPARPRYAQPSALETVLGVGLVTISSLIAFVVTCFPLGFVAITSADGHGPVTGSLLALPWLVGLGCGVGAGVLCFRLIFRSRRRRLPPPANEGRGP